MKTLLLIVVVILTTLTTNATTFTNFTSGKAKETKVEVIKVSNQYQVGNLVAFTTSKEVKEITVSGKTLYLHKVENVSTTCRQLKKIKFVYSTNRSIQNSDLYLMINKKWMAAAITK